MQITSEKQKGNTILEELSDKLRKQRQKKKNAILMDDWTNVERLKLYDLVRI